MLFLLQNYALNAVERCHFAINSLYEWLLGGFFHTAKNYAGLGYLVVITFSPDEICPHGLLLLWMFLGIQVLDHPCHVAGKGAHGLHALLILGGLTGRLSIHHVPVLGTHKRHVHHREIFVQTVEGSGGTTASADDHTRSGLVSQLWTEGIEYPVEQGAQRTVGASIIDGGAYHQTVYPIFHGPPYTVVQIVVERAFAYPPAHAAGDAALYGTFANAYNLRVDALFIQGFGHFTQCQERVAMLPWTSVD